jgi:serine/threonine-protein kinase
MAAPSTVAHTPVGMTAPEVQIPPPGPSDWVMYVGIGGPSNLASSKGLASQLRKRLIFISLLTATAVGAFLVMQLWQHGRRFLAASFHEILGDPTLQMIPCSLVIASVEAIAAILLVNGREFSIRRLRMMEGVVIFPIAAFFAYGQIVFAQSFPDTFFESRPLTVAHDEVLSWVVLMVSYGVLIPNTWWRCAAAELAIAAAAVVTHASAYTLRPLAPGVSSTMLMEKIIWLGVAGAIVVYGAYRVQVLRRWAKQARELGQYRLRERIGGGGMGEVYLADHRLLRRPAAIKLIRPDRAGDEANLARFEREVQATATLTHPNTIQIYDYGRADDGTFYYVMEYLPGITLENLVGDYGPLPAARAVHYLRQICGALGEAHAIGLVHRDLKPSNIMVCNRGRIADTVKLLDFGLVITTNVSLDDKLTQQGTIAGTPAFLSPEQAGGSDAVDARSDIYSLGAVAYFLVTGQPPFSGRSAMKVLAAHLYEQPEPITRHRPEVPAKLADIVHRCLAKAPSDRFRTVEELEASLAACSGLSQWTRQDATQWWQVHSQSDTKSEPGRMNLLTHERRNDADHS